jgi:hypothetical protein
MHRLREHYAALMQDPDPHRRALATAQLRRLDALQLPGRAGYLPAEVSTAPADVDLVALVAQVVGPLQRRGDGTQVGPCAWHASRSGTCLVVWPAEGRWWCWSCRRGGDAIGWVALVEGIDREAARRRLRLPRRGPS